MIDNGREFMEELANEIGRIDFDRVTALLIEWGALDADLGLKVNEIWESQQ